MLHLAPSALSACMHPRNKGIQNFCMVIHNPSTQVHLAQLKFLLSAMIFCGVLVSVFCCISLHGYGAPIGVMLQHVLAHSKRSPLSEDSERGAKPLVVMCVSDSEKVAHSPKLFSIPKSASSNVPPSPHPFFALPPISRVQAAILALA